MRCQQVKEGFHMYAEHSLKLAVDVLLWATKKLLI